MKRVFVVWIERVFVVWRYGESLLQRLRRLERSRDSSLWRDHLERLREFDHLRLERSREKFGDIESLGSRVFSNWESLREKLTEEFKRLQTESMNWWRPRENLTRQFNSERGGNAPQWGADERGRTEEERRANKLESRREGGVQARRDMCHTEE